MPGKPGKARKARESQGKPPPPGPRQLLRAYQLVELDKGGTWGAAAYGRVLDAFETDAALEAYRGLTEAELRAEIPGAGAKIAHRLAAALEGRAQDLVGVDGLTLEHLDTAAHVEPLLEVPGIGVKRAADLVRVHGVRGGLAGLAAFAAFAAGKRGRGQSPLTPAQLEYVSLRDELRQRIPRAEMARHEARIAHVLGARFGRGQLLWTVAGSYLRGERTSGDVDVVMTSPDGTAGLDDAIAALREAGYVRGVAVAQGPSRFRGLCRLGDSSDGPRHGLHRRFDVVFASRVEQYPFALLYYAAGAEATRELRRAARAAGLSLNERGISLANR